MQGAVCHFCGAAVAIGDVVPRDATCDACQRDLRCCRNCRHHDARYHGGCRETEAEPVTDPERRNFCEYFEWSPAPFTGGASAADRSAAARARLDALFGGTSDPKPAPPTSDARARLEALFREPDPEDAE